jgi:hypothetical protein
MFAALRSAVGGGSSSVGGATIMQVQMELQQLKAAPLLNPHYGMVVK